LKKNIALVEEVVEESDYRIVVLDNEIIAVYRKVPLLIVENGVKTIKNLLDEKNLKQVDVAKDIEIYSDDPNTDRKLKRSGLNVYSVLAKGEVELVSNMGLRYARLILWQKMISKRI
jgi:D-alanine-D-alanine ligase-like ATP-grasp enzyme